MISYKSRFDDDSIGQEVVDDAIDFIWGAFEAGLHSQYLDGMRLDYTAKLMIGKMDKMVALAMMMPDGIFKQNSPVLELYNPDGEPAPSNIDSWARGSVYVKKVMATEQFRPMPGSSNTPSIASSHRSGRTGTSASGIKSRIGTAKSRDDPLDHTGKIMELDDEWGDFAHLNLNATGQLYDQLQKAKRNKAQGYTTKETSEKGEFEIIQDQMDHATKEMRGRKFVLDKYGKAIPVGKVIPEALPPFAESPQLLVKEPQEKEMKSRYDDPLADSTDSMGAVVKKQKAIRVAGSRNIEQGVFIPAITLASTLSGIENIPKVNDGVSVRSISGVREGKELPEHPVKMSKKSYLKAQSSLMSSTDSAILGENSSISLSKSLGRQVNARAGSLSSADLNDSSIITSKSIEYMQDIDPFESSSIIEPPVELMQDPTDEDLGLGIISKPRPGGKVVPVIPKRRTQKQRELELHELMDSPDHGKIRDRDFPKNMVPTSLRRHLPAPALGSVTGHGFMSDNTKSPVHKEDSNDWTSDWR